MGRYRLFLKPSAVKEIEAISEKKIRQRLVRAIALLADEPRPHGSQKLSGHDRYRIRCGPFRIVYAVNDSEAIVSVGEELDIAGTSTVEGCDECVASKHRTLLMMPILALAPIASMAAAEEPFRFEGTTCTPAAYLHCPDTECSAATVINQGNVVEMKTRRTYFLDYPCDLKAGEKVTFILAPPRRRFVRELAAPLLPAARLQGRAPAGDRHAELADARVVRGRRPVPAEHRRLRHRADRRREHQVFLAGRTLAGRHDLEPADSHRLLQDQGRRLAEPVGRPPGRQSRPQRDLRAHATRDHRSGAGRAGAAAPGSTGPGSSSFAAAMAALREPPDADLSFIYTTGEREVDEKGVPETSDWATKYACGARREGDRDRRRQGGLRLRQLAA